jgi:hypothetical protein
MSGIALSDFTLLSAHCELRHAPSYALWDSAGAVWSSVVHGVSSLDSIDASQIEHAQVKPDAQVLKIDQRFELAVSLDKHHSHVRRPKADLDEFAQVHSFLTGAVEEKLGINVYTRIGLLLRFVKEFSDLKEAVEFANQHGVIRRHSGRYFDVAGKPSSFRKRLHVDEGKKGWSIDMWTEENTYALGLPLDWQGAEPPNVKKGMLTINVDRFEKGPVLAAELRMADWIMSTGAVIARDLEAAIEEVIKG